MIYEENLESRFNIQRFGLIYLVERKLTWVDLFKLLVAKLRGEICPLTEVLPNALLNEGEKNVLDVYFRNTNVPASFYIGLGNNGGTPGIPAETATLLSITEVSGTGYARQAVARNTTDWSAPQLDNGDYQTTSSQETFENTGGSDWSAADYAFLTDASSGTAGLLLSAVALSQSRVLKPGEQLKVTIKQKGQ